MHGIFPRANNQNTRIVLKTLKISEYLNTTYCIFENPQTGLLKEQPFIIMYGLPYQDIDYCKYGTPYGKRTRLWNNVFQWNPKQLCKKDSGNIIDTKHTATAQRGPCKGLPNNKFNQAELYIIPVQYIYI